MKRREWIAVLFGAATLSHAPAEAQELSDECVRQMLRFFGGVEPRPSEVEHVRLFLLSFRGAGAPAEPDVEPAVTFDPRFAE